MPSSSAHIYPLSLHDALPICFAGSMPVFDSSPACVPGLRFWLPGPVQRPGRSEEHTSELQSLRHLVCRLLPLISTLFPYTTLFRSVSPVVCPCSTPRQRAFPDYAFGFPDPSSGQVDRKSTRLNSSHLGISYAVFFRSYLPSFPTRRSSDLFRR